MSSQQNNVNAFTENGFIHLIDVETVNGQEAINLSINYLKNDLSTTSHVFNAWCTKLLRFYGLEAIQFEELKEIFSLHYEYINGLIESLINIEELNDTDLSIIKSNLKDWNNLFEWIKEIVKDLTLLDLSFILQTAIKTIQKYNIFALKRRRFKNNEQSIFQILNESQMFLSKALAIFNENPTIFICNNQASMEIIVLIILNLCTVGELVALIDIKSTAQTWKCVTALSTDNSEYLKQNFAWNIGPNWLSRPIKYLCGEIKGSVKTIYQNDEQNQEPIDSIERQLKITSFYLKLLIKISSDYQHTFFPNCKEVISFMLTASKPPNHIIGSKTQILLKQYLYNGFSNLLNFIYKNPDVKQLTFERITSETGNLAGIVISLEVLKALLAETQESFINEFVFSNDSNIFEDIFKIIPNNNIPESSEIFGNIIQIFSAFFITNLNNEKLVKHLEKLIVNGVLHPNQDVGNICINIWLIIASFAEASQRYAYLKFWWKCRTAIFLPSYEIVSLQVDTLIQSLYDILPITLQSKFWNSLNKKELENSLIVLGLDRYPDEIKKKLLFNEQSIQLYQKLQSSDESFESENYVKFISSLKILLTTKLEFKNNICNLVAKFLTTFIEEIIEIQTFNTLFNLLCEFVSTKIDEIEPATVTNLLNIINCEATKFESIYIKQTVCNLVTSLQKKSLYEILSSNCLTSLKTNNSNYNRKLDMKLNTRSESRYTNDIKRKKEDENVHAILETIFSNVQDFKKYSNCNRLNSSEKVMVVEVVNSLNKVLQNEQ